MTLNRPLPMTLHDIHGHSRITGLLKRDLSYSFPAVDKISTDIARRAVPPRQLSFL